MDSRETTQLERGSRSDWLLFQRLGRAIGLVYRATLAKPAAREILIGIGIFCALVAILQIGQVPRRADVVVGKPASQAILAPRDIMDLQATQRQREEAARRTQLEAEQDPANWYIAPESTANAEARLARFLQDIEEARASLAGEGDSRQAAVERLRGEWSGVTTEAWEGLLAADPERMDQLRKSLRRLLVAIEENERIIALNLQSFREDLPQVIDRLGGNRNDRVLAGALRGLIAPNLVLDKARVANLVEQAKDRVSTFYYRAGAPILDKGEIVTKEKFELLRAERLITGSNVPLDFISLVLLVLLLIALALGYLYRFRRGFLRQEKLLYLMALTMTIAAIMGRFFALDPQSNLA